jgi:ApaG protein
MSKTITTELETYLIKVKVVSSYVAEQSLPEINRYVFAYTVTIRNEGTIPARLISRHWVITDANGKIQEVRGLGVVGEQPYLRPGEHYQYTSGAVLETPIGNMQGSYQMLADDKTQFDAKIPAFTLFMPNTLH